MTKANVMREELQAALKAVSPFAVNGFVTVESSASNLILSAAGKFSAKYSIPAEVEGNFGCNVSAKRFAAMVTKSTDENIGMAFEKFVTKVTTKPAFNLKISEKASYKLIGEFIQGQQFTDEVEYPKSFSVDSKKFCEMVKKVYPAISTSKFEKEEMYKGITFEVEGENLNLLAAEGHRIAKASAKIENAENAKFNIRADVLKVFADNVVAMEQSGNVAIFYNNDEFEIKFSDYEVRGTLTQGAFVNYAKGLPTKAEISAMIQKSDFLDSLSKVEMFTKYDDNHTAELNLLGGQGIRFIVINPEIGKAEYFEAAEVIGTKNILVNAENLKKAVSALNGQIVLGISKNNSDVEILTVSEINNEEFIFGVTPCKSEGQQISEIKRLLETTKENLDSAKIESENAKATVKEAKATVEKSDEVIGKIENRIAEFKTLKVNSISAIKGHYELKISKSNEKIDALKSEISKAEDSLKKAKQFGYETEATELKKKIESLNAELKAAKKDFSAERKTVIKAAVEKEISEDKSLSFLNKKIARFEKILENQKAKIKAAEKILNCDYVQKTKDNLKEIKKCYDSLSAMFAEIEQAQKVAA